MISWNFKNECMKKHFVFLGIAIAAGLVAFAALGTVSFSATDQLDQGVDGSPACLYKLNKKYDGDYENGVLRVRAGTGGAVAPVTWFFPNNANIKVGETVVWYNPTGVAEPHTDLFVWKRPSCAGRALRSQQRHRVYAASAGFKR